MGPDSLRTGSHPSVGQGDHKHLCGGGYEVGGNWHPGTAGGALNPPPFLSDDTSVTDCETVLVRPENCQQPGDGTDCTQQARRAALQSSWCQVW